MVTQPSRRVRKATAHLLRKDTKPGVLHEVFVSHVSALQKLFSERHCPTSSGLCQRWPILDGTSLCSTMADQPLPNATDLVAADQLAQGSTCEPLVLRGLTALLGIPLLAAFKAHLLENKGHGACHISTNPTCIDPMVLHCQLSLVVSCWGFLSGPSPGPFLSLTQPLLFKLACKISLMPLLVCPPRCSRYTGFTPIGAHCRSPTPEVKAVLAIVNDLYVVMDS